MSRKNGLKTLINKQDFYYNELVHEITDDIIENLLLSIRYDQKQYHWPYNLKIDDEEEYLNFTYSTRRILSKNFIKNDITGSSGLDECCLPHVKIQMLLQERKWMRNHDYKYSQIAGVVAHELHHLTQDFSLVNYSFGESIVEYFLNPIEIEAFHVGFRAEANLSSVAIEDCIKRYLGNYLNDKRITKKEYEKILVNWLNPEIKLLKGVK
jgi:hypothetical protein